MVLTMKRSTREQEAALDQWRAAVARVAATGDLMAEALHGLRATYAEIDREMGAEAAGIAYAVPERLCRMFEGAENRFMGADELAVQHVPSLYESWREQMHIRGWLAAPEDHNRA